LAAEQMALPQVKIPRSSPARKYPIRNNPPAMPANWIASSTHLGFA